MPQVNTYLPNLFDNALGRMIVDGLARAKAERARRAVYNRVLNELGAMSDRDLADIGMNRLIIGDVAHRAAYGEE